MIKVLRIVTVTSLGLLLLLPGPTQAQQQLADVENLGDTLVFHPLVEFAELVLTVTGPCDFQYRQRVSQGEPLFRLDPTTIDGVYRFDLVRIEQIDPAIVEILQQARVKDDEETPRQLCRDGKLPAPPVAQSEGFVVFRGEIIYDPKAVEESAAKGALTPTRAGLSAASGGAQGDLENMAAADFVIIDDLIVDGSACIGFDCVNGESFGFDTVRLKENNLRIKFDDTSTAASFPRNDWQLTANDSANGGLSKFSIDDISGSRTPFTIEANARSHSLYVDDGGRIGSRTSTPSTEIHTVDGDTPTLRLQQDGSSGFAPQTWDVAGNETNFFIRDVTNGSQLPFRIRPDAPTSSIDIASDGDVGVGTASPDAPLHVVDTATPSNGVLHVDTSSASTTGERIIMQLENKGVVGFRMVDTANTNQWTMRINNNGFTFNSTDGNGAQDEFRVSEAGEIYANGVFVASSRELKENFVTLDPRNILSKVVDLPISQWNYKTESDGVRHIGPVAEDFQASFGLNEDNRTVSLADVSGIALAAVQGLHQLVTEKDGRIDELEEENSSLAQRVEALEGLVQSLAAKIAK